MSTNLIYLPTSDPRGFGPIVWKAIHTLAVNYPIEASIEKRRSCVQFLLSLSYLLPCSECGEHFRDYLERHNYRKASRGRYRLMKLLVGAHNAIKKHTAPQAPPWTIADAKKKYKRVLLEKPLRRLWPKPPVENNECSCSSSL